MIEVTFCASLWLISYRLPPSRARPQYPCRSISSTNVDDSPLGNQYRFAQHRCPAGADFHSATIRSVQTSQRSACPPPPRYALDLYHRRRKLARRARVNKTPSVIHSPVLPFLRLTNGEHFLQVQARPVRTLQATKSHNWTTAGLPIYQIDRRPRVWLA